MEKEEQKVTPADTVRKAVAEACGLPLESVTDETRLPEHNTALTPVGCQKCRILFALCGDRWAMKDDVFVTVSDLIRYVEAREAEGRG